MRSIDASSFGGQRGDMATRLPVQRVEVCHGVLHGLVVEPGRTQLCFPARRQEYSARGGPSAGVSGDDQVAVTVQKPAKVSRPDATVAHRLDLEAGHDSLDRADLTVRGRIVHVESGVT